jgi:hypothetical protein
MKKQKKIKLKKAPRQTRKQKEKRKEIESVPPSRRGKFQNQSTVAFSFSPAPEAPQDSELSILAKKIEEAFLSFLKNESKKERPSVMFGGLIWQKESLPEKEEAIQKEEEKNEKETSQKKVAQAFFLSTAFCPFEKRTFHPRARILATEEGKILSISSPSKAQRK